MEFSVFVPRPPLTPVVFASYSRQRGAEQQGICFHHEATFDERPGEAQRHGLHPPGAGHVEMCTGYCLGLRFAQTVTQNSKRGPPPYPTALPLKQSRGTGLPAAAGSRAAFLWE